MVGVALPSPALTSCLHPWVLEPLEEVVGLVFDCDWRLGDEGSLPLELTLALPVVLAW